MSRMINDKIMVLKKGLSVPDIVTEKAEEAFRRIQIEDAGQGAAGIQAGDAEYTTAGKKTASCGSGKKKAWAAVVAILVMSTATVSAAAYIRWSQSLEKGLLISKTQKTALENDHAVSNPNLSVTDCGVTITAQQCIVDKYSAFITFKIKGYELRDDGMPMFAAKDIRFDGEDGFNGSHSFYTRVLADQAKGYLMYDDGTPIGREEEISNKDAYVMDDGSLEYHIQCSGDFRGRQIHVEFTGLGTLDSKEKIEFDAPGTWTFDWTLEGTDVSEEFALNEPLGDTGIVVSAVEFCPISARVTYRMPDNMTKSSYADQAEYVTEVCEKTPQLSAVHTRSGELIFIPFHGTVDWSGSDNETMYLTTWTEQIMEPDEIDALWFCKDGFYAKNLFEPYDEDEFYIVPIK